MTEALRRQGWSAREASSQNWDPNKRMPLHTKDPYGGGSLMIWEGCPKGGFHGFP